MNKGAREHFPKVGLKVQIFQAEKMKKHSRFLGEAHHLACFPVTSGWPQSNNQSLQKTTLKKKDAGKKFSQNKMIKKKST